MRIEDMTSEQIEKAKECETTEQRLAFIKEIGLELSDEQLDTIAGGAAWSEDYEGGCPSCKCVTYSFVDGPRGVYIRKCDQCGCRYDENGTIYE